MDAQRYVGSFRSSDPDGGHQSEVQRLFQAGEISEEARQRLECVPGTRWCPEAPSSPGAPRKAAKVHPWTKKFLADFPSPQDEPELSLDAFMKARASPQLKEYMAKRDANPLRHLGSGPAEELELMWQWHMLQLARQAAQSSP